MSKIKFTKHASQKFSILRKYGFKVSKKQVLQTVETPDYIDQFSRAPLLIVQRTIDSKHVLRVIYKKEESHIVIITFYPGRIRQYGKTQ